MLANFEWYHQEVQICWTIILKQVGWYLMLKHPTTQCLCDTQNIISTLIRFFWVYVIFQIVLLLLPNLYNQGYKKDSWSWVLREIWFKVQFFLTCFVTWIDFLGLKGACKQSLNTTQGTHVCLGPNHNKFFHWCWVVC
jgi:hypothetical protein